MAIDRDYRIGVSSRTCQGCGRKFGVGEEYYSAVVAVEGEEMFARHDFCPDCWSPDGGEYFSFWKTRVPEPSPPRRSGPRLVDLDRLVQLFEHLADADQEHARRFRYVLALVLMRRKRLRLVSSRRLRGGREEELTLREVGSGRRHVVTCPAVSEDEIRSVTDRLRDILDMPDQWDRVDAESPEQAEPPVPDPGADADGGESGKAEPADTWAEEGE